MASTHLDTLAAFLRSKNLTLQEKLEVLRKLNLEITGKVVRG